MKSVYIRNFLATAIMVLICTIAIAATLVGIGRNYIISGYSSNMFSTVNEVRRMVNAVEAGSSDSGFTLKIFLTSIGNSTGNLILLTDETGTVTMCSDPIPGCNHKGKSLSPEVVEEIEANGTISGITDLDSFFDSRNYVVAVPSSRPDSDESHGYVIVSNRIDNILESWNKLLSIVSLVSVAVFALVMVTALLYWRRMAKPLDEIAEASRKFARGDFSVRVKQVGDTDDEMGALIDSFNKMADSLESAEKRRSEFISNISHELRTPMTTIGGFADGILDGTIPPEDQTKYLTAIRDETRRLSRLVRNMLDVSRAKSSASDPSRRTDFDLTELTLQTLLSFESRATKKKLDVDPQFPDAHIMVRADKDAITRVIYNLIDNAVKFANTGSCLTVKLYKDEYKAYVAVRDEGETIPPDDLPFIFDRFHKSDRSRSIDKDGVGLGLYLVKTIINEHDEDIAVRSENGMTEFVFTLSLAETAEKR